MMHFFSIFSAFAALVGIASAGTCDNDYGSGDEEFEPYFFLNNMSNPNIVCNIDPSQSNLDFAIAVGGEFCISNADTVTIYLGYTGTDGLTSTASVVTTISEAYYSSVDLIFTGMPASAISNGSPITVTAFDTSISGSDCGATSTSYFQSTFTATQTFVPTIVYTDSSTAISSPVPSTTTTTSTVTNQAVAAAPASSTTITSTSGTDTVVASSYHTTTVVRTITQRTYTRRSIITNTSTVSSSCISAKPSAAVAMVNRRNNWVGRVPNLQMLKRQTASDTSSGGAMTYITGYCTTPLQTTDIYTSTATFTSTYTDTNNVTTSTAYVATTTTSTYTPTDTFYVTSASTTYTFTPTVTKKSTTVLTKKTTTVTYTTTVTKTKYPKNAPPCASS